LIVKPQLEPLTWRDPFSVEVSDKFTTSVDNRVPLKIVARLYISDLSKVGKYLNTDIKAEIRDTIRGITEGVILQIDPYRFYMRFDSDHEGGTPVAAILKNDIKNKLEEKFAATIESITPQMVKETNDVIHRLDELMSQFGNLDFQVDSVAGWGETTHFKGRFRVGGVDNSREAWDKFIKSKFGMAEITDAIQEYVISEVHSASSEALQYKDREHHISIKDIVKQLAQDYARNAFGLGITLDWLRRDETDTGKKAKNAHIAELEAAIKLKEAETKAVLTRIERDQNTVPTQIEFEEDQQLQERNRLRKLRQKLTEYIEDGIEDVEIQRLKQAISEIEEKYKRQPDDKQQHLKQLFNLLKTDGTTSRGQEKSLTGKEQLEAYKSASLPNRSQLKQPKLDKSSEHSTIDQENNNDR
jgi:hypothetical protein